ncbi:MAG: CNNM domain-containing protein [Planctomycetaceae bacterium]
MIGLLLFLLGLSFSAFFSGSETGMYRVSRMRLLLDALDGSWISRAMLWLLNHPAVFVATALVGNNIANFTVSFGIVSLVADAIGGGPTMELLGTAIATPIVFVLGELFPKYVFYNAPYRLLHAVRPLLLFVTVLFLPISIILGFLGDALRALTGEAPFQLRLAMQRAELEQVLREGHEAGLLAGGQRLLAQNIFEIGNEPAIRFGVPVDRLAVVTVPINIAAAQSEARRRSNPVILVKKGGKIIGCLHYANLLAQTTPEIEPVVECSQDEHHLRVLLKLYEAGSQVAVLVDAAGKPQGIVTQQHLLQSFLAVNSRPN